MKEYKDMTIQELLLEQEKLIEKLMEITGQLEIVSDYISTTIDKNCNI